MNIEGDDPNSVMIRCGVCGKSWWTVDPGMVCTNCSNNRMLAQLDPVVRSELDQLLNIGEEIEAIKLLQGHLPVGLQEAMELASHRKENQKSADDHSA